MTQLPEPKVDAESRPFYAAADEGRFLIRRCDSCGDAHWYPRSICPFCGGATDWEEASGRGEVYSYAVMVKADPPYVLAYVTLAEGPTMLTNIISCRPEAVRIGLPVELEWQQAGEVRVPCFRPSAA